MSFTVEDLRASETARAEAAARLIHLAFARFGAWTTMSEARDEVAASFGDDRMSRAAITDDGMVLGWIAAIRQYDGLVWELHPIVVDERFRRHGVGRALVNDLEARLSERGALTLWAGSDDIELETSLGGIDLYATDFAAQGLVESWGSHPLPFYRRLGFKIVGVMPDANGRGRPDVFLAKRIAGEAD